MEPERRFRNTAEWKAFSRRIIERDGRCMVCGQQPGDRSNPLTAGHLVAVSRGGAIYDEANARAECQKCNSRRGTTR